jgi:hypothetical protein
MGNEHNTNELLQKSVYKNRKKTKTQRTSREQEDNNKEQNNTN